MRPGQMERRTHDYDRHGTTTGLASKIIQSEGRGRVESRSRGLPPRGYPSSRFILVDGVEETCEIPPSRLGAPHPAVRDHLHRPRVHFRGGTPHPGSVAHRSSGLGVGDGDVHALLWHLRDSDRRPGGSDWPATRVDARGAVVVGLHVAHRHGVELLPAPDCQIVLRRRRGRCVSKRRNRRLPLVSCHAAREHVRRAADGEPDWRRDSAAAGGPDPDSIWLACVVLSVRRAGSPLVGHLVLVVPRLAGGKARCERSRARRDGASASRISSWLSVERRASFRERSRADGCGLLLRLRIQLLPDVVSHVSREGARVHGREPRLLRAAVRGRRVSRT